MSFLSGLSHCGDDRMKTVIGRRRLVSRMVGAAGLLAADRSSAWAQLGTQPRRIGLLLFSNPQTDPNTQAFRRALRDLGYEEGRNVLIDYRYAEGKPERLAELAAELVR